MDKRFEEWIDLHGWNPSYGFTTKALAAYLGVSARTIQRWVKGIGEPSEAQLARIEQFTKENNQKNS